MILKPDYNHKALDEIDFAALKEQGVEAVVFDLDSTVMASKSAQFDVWVIELLCTLKESFVVAILSNNKCEEYIEKARQQCDIEVIGRANKPSPKTLLEFLERHEIKPENAVMVGDRPLTDILAGKLARCKTILVDSITYRTEPKLTRFVRFLERLVIRN